MWKFKWFAELDKWKFKICRLNFLSKQSNSERKARPTPARKFSHQFLRQNKAVKNLKKSAKLKIIEQIQELSIVTSCTFSSNLRRWRKKRRTWVLTRNETRFLSLWFCFSCLTLITRFSRCSLLYIFFLWSETVTYDTRVSRTVSRRGP